MKEKKDVLILCQYFYPEYISSATLPYDTALALSNSGLTVGVLTGYPKEYSLTDKTPLKEAYGRINIKRLKYIQLKRSSFIGRLINYFSFTFSVALNLRELKKYKAVIVYSSPPVLPLIASIANAIYKTKLVFVSYDVYPEIALVTNAISENGVICKLMNFINKNLFKNVNKVVALSNEMKAHLLKNRKGLLEHQIEVIPNWFDDNGKLEIKNGIQNENFKLLSKDKKLIVSYFGNMGTCQELDTIIEAIKEFKHTDEIHFIFAGHGNRVKDIRDFIEKEQLCNVTVYDFLHGQDYQEALSVSDCFIVSLAEGVTGLAVPSKTYGYMMAGRPVIAIMDKESDIAEDLTSHKAGYAMEVGEVDKFVCAIKDLLNNKAKQLQMGENCRSLYLKKYTKEKCTKQYVDMMYNVLEG